MTNSLLAEIDRCLKDIYAPALQIQLKIQLEFLSQFPVIKLTKYQLLKRKIQRILRTPSRFIHRNCY